MHLSEIPKSHPFGVISLLIFEMYVSLHLHTHTFLFHRVKSIAYVFLKSDAYG